MAARCRRGTHACGLRTADAATARGLTRSLNLNCYGLRIDLMDIEETEAAPPKGPLAGNCWAGQKMITKSTLT